MNEREIWLLHRVLFLYFGSGKIYWNNTPSPPLHLLGKEDQGFVVVVLVNSDRLDMHIKQIVLNNYFKVVITNKTFVLIEQK